MALILVPLCLAVTVGRLPRRYRVWVAAALSLAATFFFCLELIVYLQVLGTFLSAEVLFEAIKWGWVHTEALAPYVARHLDLVLSVLAMNGIAQFAIYCLSGQTPLRWQRRTAWATGLAFVAMTAVAWLPDVPHTPFHRSVYSLFLTALFPDSAHHTSGTLSSRPVSAEELQTRYRALTRAPGHEPLGEYWGTAKGFNVIFFVLETAPARITAFDLDLDDLPTVRRLRERSWVAARHYATSSMSNRATFSLFSSLYPPSSAPIVKNPNLTVPGTLQSLKAEGYKTALYLPFTLLAEWENWVFKSLGFQRVMIAEEVTDQRWVGLRGLDGVALETLKEDVARWVKQGERFIAAFLPQIGHAPWPDLLDNNIKDDLAARGRYVVSLQDKWLGETVDLLEQLGQLDRTLIIVTSDHGIRTAFEDPSFTRGRLDEYSFHVPFLLYAPEVLSTTQQIDWVSSHLDVIPSVLDLLGIDAGRDFEQGSPLWNPELRERRTYFWAESMAASDGYYAMGRYSMWNRILDSVYVNETLYFEAPHQVSRGSSVHQEVVTNVSQMAELQRLWLAKALRKNP